MSTTIGELLRIFGSCENEADWEKSMDYLLSRIKSDKILMLRMNYFQDLCCNLRLQGVRPCVQDLYGARGSQELIQEWKDVPPVVCAVLAVPRPENLKPSEIMTPSVCETRGPTFRNIHSPIRQVWKSSAQVDTRG